MQERKFRIKSKLYIGGPDLNFSSAVSHILGDPGAASRVEGIFVGESCPWVSEDKFHSDCITND